ncbi:hypothetical protein BK120_21720 [Paenibacillus sp. FSL A5-0031]|uniref:hypothetical protein n=1 Tax=Paenibacillus sp. FSL A5-0031 TaxID=1920420 RepID=UPI00096ED36C|nr:hypothetical protein [Paenibacillus sp. FSL A5-0031]OME79597.1 hypothetical protein BK120_21720 [Paenibacillus sp. FSL A5-0031]
MLSYLASETSEAYLKKMKKMYAIDVNQLGALEWVLVIAGTFATIVSTIALVYWLYKIILFLWQVKLAKANLNDSIFWKRMGIALVIIMLFVTSGMFAILEGIFNVLGKMGWTM